MSNISCQSILKYYKTQLNVKKFDSNCLAKVLDGDREAPVVCYGLQSRKLYSRAVQVRDNLDGLDESVAS